MKTLFSVLLGLGLATLGFAQPAYEIGSPRRTPQDLEKLLAPIALYPDALIALILPASTNSSDVVLAARFLANQPADAIEGQPWEDSVKSLAHYPEVVKWMDENLTWTREVGEAFAAQPADVMNTIQRLRADARANGLLQDTPEQKVVVRDTEICIDPAQDDVIYVPSYDPEILIDRRPAYDSWMSFSVGFATGSWLVYDCDWGSRSVWVYRRPNGWNFRPDWRWRDRGDHIRIVHEEWRANPAFREHVRDSRTYATRAVPHVEPPHFAEHESRGGSNRGWDGRRDNPGNSPRAWNGRPEVGRDHSWDLQQQQHANSAVESHESHDARIRNQNTHPVMSLHPSGASAPVVAVPIAPDANADAPVAHTSSEHHSRTDGVTGTRNYPREINNPPAQRTDTPATVRQQPPAPPSPERIGQVAPRGAQYTTPHEPTRPVNYRHDSPAAPPAPAPVAPVQHSAPAPVVQPAAAAPAPAPAANPGRDQRGGYQNSGHDDGRDRDRR